MQTQLVIALIVGITAILALMVVLVIVAQTFGDKLEKGTEKGGLLCRSCKSRSVHPSYRRGAVDGLLAIFGCEPYRCNVCSWRFYVRRPGISAGAASR